MRTAVICGAWWSIRWNWCFSFTLANGLLPRPYATTILCFVMNATSRFCALFLMRPGSTGVCILDTSMPMSSVELAFSSTWLSQTWELAPVFLAGFIVLSFVPINRLTMGLSYTEFPMLLTWPVWTLVLGARRTSPVVFLQVETHIPLLSLRRL